MVPEVSEMPISVESAGRSEVGHVRSHNEDDWFADEGAGVFVVADGMGGHAAGEVASAITVAVLGDRLPGLAEQPEDDSARETLAESVVEAGRRVYRQGEEDPDQKGMGTTVTALVLRPSGRFMIGHVGDSRAYLLRDGELSQVTHDHSPHPGSSVLTRALGTEEVVQPDLFEGECRPGDVFLLSSDGLTDMVGDPDIRALLGGDGEAGGTAAVDPSAAADRLVEAALENGGRDNVTVLLVRVDAVD